MLLRNLLTIAIVVLFSGSAFAVPTTTTTTTTTALELPRGVTFEAEGTFLPISMLEPIWVDHFQQEAPPEGLDPLESARYWLHDRDLNGRTATGWIDDLQERFTLDRVQALPPADLASEVARLYDTMGITVDPATLAELEARADAMPSGVRGPFAGLVAVVVDAYAEQDARAGVILDRVHAGFEIPTASALVTPEERDAMAALEARVLAALNTFRFLTEGAFADMQASGDDHLFEDPTGLIVLGGLGNDEYGRVSADILPVTSGNVPALDPVLQVDPSGDDTYRNSAGGACPDVLGTFHRCNALAFAAVYDLGGNDRYEWDAYPMAVQGAGSAGGLGMLVDVAGADSYVAEFERVDRGPFFQYIDGGAQGFAQAGSGLILDGAGDDVYALNVATQGRSIWGFGQGYGSAGSLGVALDLGGNDQWTGIGHPWTSGGGFSGQYPQGTGFYGGVGVILDVGLGDDLYHVLLEGRTTDYYAQGFGAFGGVGIQYEDGGDDRYWTQEEAYNPWINPLLNCAYGTASLGGVGIFLEVSGNDTYFGNTISPRQAHTMNEGFGGIGAAYGIHIEVEGDDRHEMYAEGAEGSFVDGRGEVLQGGNIIGNYLDAGGDDIYVGPGRDNGVWLGGADANYVPTDIV